MTGRLDRGEVVGVTVGEATRVGAAARLMLHELGDSAEALAEGAAALATELPVSLVRVLHRFGNAGSAHNTLPVRGMLPPTTARLGLTGVQAAKLGAAVAADHRDHGYATDAARTILDFGFGPLGLHRITAAIGPDNAASIAGVERYGFSYEGRLRDHVFTNGGWRDSLLYSMLAPDWRNPQTRDPQTSVRCDRR